MTRHIRSEVELRLGDSMISLSLGERVGARGTWWIATCLGDA
jgi:hypothetical protein